MKPYYKDNWITIYNIDCLEGMKLLADESVDLVFTDPPFNISQRNKICRDSRKGEGGDIKFDFGEWDYNFNPILFLEESKRILNDNGSIIVWTSEQLFGLYRNWFQENMYPKQLLIWVKTNPLPQFRLVGYRQATELLYWALKKKNTKSNPNFNFLSQKEMTNVFYAPIVVGKERTKHPNQKPLSITKEIIRRHCRKEGVVVDSFFGSGTTLKGCKDLSRYGIGFETKRKYCDMAVKRVRQDKLF